MLLPIELTAFDNGQKIHLLPHKICYFFLTKGSHPATTIVMDGASPMYVNETPAQIIEKIRTELFKANKS